MTVLLNATSGVVPVDNNTYLGGSTIKAVLGNTGALAKTGLIFVGWTDKEGKILSTNPTYSFTLTENMELTANFTDRCDLVLCSKRIN